MFTFRVITSTSSFSLFSLHWVVRNRQLQRIAKNYLEQKDYWKTQESINLGHYKLESDILHFLLCCSDPAKAKGTVRNGFIILLGVAWGRNSELVRGGGKGSQNCLKVVLRVFILKVIESLVMYFVMDEASWMLEDCIKFLWSSLIISLSFFVPIFLFSLFMFQSITQENR